jgi:hypothetical protein
MLETPSWGFSGQDDASVLAHHLFHTEIRFALIFETVPAETEEVNFISKISAMGLAHL